MIALTFDDGPGPSTAAILDALRAQRVHATFFVVGRNVADSPWTDTPALGRTLVKRALSEGHVVGNHTFTHAREQSEQDFVREIHATDSIVKELNLEVGLPTVTPPFRLPYGPLDKDPRLRFCAALGRPHVHWSKDFDDWHEGPIAGLSPAILAYIEERERLGLNSVLDLHDGGIGGSTGYERSATAQAVRHLLGEAAMRGWRFFTVPL